MRLLLLTTCFVFAVSHAKVDEAMQKKIDEIMPAIKTIASGAPDDWSQKDRKAFDQFVVDIVKGKFLTISQELTKLKQRSTKAYVQLRPLAIYFKNGYEQLKVKEARQFFLNEIPAVTSEGVGFGDMISIAFNYWQLPDEATAEIDKVFPEVFEIEF